MSPATLTQNDDFVSGPGFESGFESSNNAVTPSSAQVRPGAAVALEHELNTLFPGSVAENWIGADAFALSETRHEQFRAGAPIGPDGLANASLKGKLGEAA